MDWEFRLDHGLMGMNDIGIQIGKAISCCGKEPTTTDLYITVLDLTTLFNSRTSN